MSEIIGIIRNYSQDEIKDSFRQNICPECKDGLLSSLGFTHNSFVSVHKCLKCGVEFEFVETDMGQTLPNLQSKIFCKVTIV